MMSKRKPDRRPSKSRSRGTPNSPIGNPAEVLTVGWMLTIVTVIACELGWLASLGAASLWPESAAPAALGAVLLLAALLSWLIAMGLLPVVLKLRSEPPPASIIWFAVALGALPLGVMVSRALG